MKKFFTGRIGQLTLFALLLILPAVFYGLTAKEAGDQYNRLFDGYAPGSEFDLFLAYYYRLAELSNVAALIHCAVFLYVLSDCVCLARHIKVKLIYLLAVFLATVANSFFITAATAFISRLNANAAPWRAVLFALQIVYICVLAASAIALYALLYLKEKRSKAPAPA
ncbi:MAG: hypothetical protein LBL66_00890 [Clostridiales bacterium]|jgi:hypothetical protein|nr:hypothetical protein [Clostridiales bacterium]